MKGLNKNKKGMVLGLTGSFGSGKTTVARVFRSCGAKIIDADRIAHGIIRPGTKVYSKILSYFGRDILKKDARIDRERLGGIVFKNKILLKRLTEIMHPEIIRIIKEKIRIYKGRVIVLDAPLLIEAGLRGLTDRLIVVKINKAKQIKRLLSRTYLNKKDILKRVKQQIPLKEKIRMADFIIDNNGSRIKTRKEVEKIRRKLWKS